MASFLTGIGGPGMWGEYEVPQYISSQNFQFAGFVQDNWKATDKLTLNLGLRYDLDLPRTERFNGMSYLDPDVASPLQVPGFSNLKGGLRFVDSNDRHNYGADYRDFGPRFGFAYRVTDKLVVRGGYGVFYSVSRRGAAGGGGSGWLGFAETTNWITTFQSDGATPFAGLAVKEASMYPPGLQTANPLRLSAIGW